VGITTRILKTSDFLDPAVMMSPGLYQNYLLANGQGVPPWLVGGRAYPGVLSILVVVGFAVHDLGVVGRLRQAVTGLFVVNQWDFR
jgi:hypothetical protein